MHNLYHFLFQFVSSKPTKLLLLFHDNHNSTHFARTHTNINNVHVSPLPRMIYLGVGTE